MTADSASPIQGHHAVLLRSRREAAALMASLGVSPEGLAGMQSRAVFHAIILHSLSYQAADIIKQEMLAVGAEAAIDREAVFDGRPSDVLLMGTWQHYRQVVRSLRSQPYGLRPLAEAIDSIMQGLEAPPPVLQLPGGRELALAQRTHIMGILNVTPDSFSDGGRWIEPSRALERALQMREEGADIIDIGAVSSRPDGELASEDEELRRLLPVLERLAGHGLIISVDTFRGRVAGEALAAGAHIINDIGTLRLDPGLLPVMAENQAPLVLMHNRLQKDQGRAYSSDLVGDIIGELDSVMEQAAAAGLDRSRIILDPGIGFGKDPGQNRLLIQRLAEFKSLGRPILVGASRKRFIGATLGLEVEDRLEGSLAVLVMAISGGASILRVHDVRESRRAAQMADAIMRQSPPASGSQAHA